MKRVAFITDQHLCRESRWEETQRVMDWCAEQFEEMQPDVIAFGGDLFDRKPTVEEMKACAEWLHRLGNIAPVVGVRGNHDPKGLAMFNLIESKYAIHFAEVPECVSFGGVSFVLLPWPSKAALLAALGGQGGELAQQVGVEQMLNVLRGLGAVAESTRAVGVPKCFVGHVQLAGARVSTGQPMMPGCDFELGTEDLALTNCDAYLLGHVHLPADLTANGKPCLMGGSFRRTAYGETEDKSIVVVTFDDGDVATTERITIPCARMFLVEDEWGVGNLTGQYGWLVGMHGMPDVGEIQGAEIRFRYTMAADQRAGARAAAEAFREVCLKAGAADVKLDERVIAAGSARAPEVAKATTLEQKLSAYWTARGTTPDDVRAQRLVSMAKSIETEVFL